MQQQSPSGDYLPSRLMRRLNRAFGEINAFLLAVAIGLAVLDLTCFVTLKASLEITRAQAGARSGLLTGSLGRMTPSIPEPVRADFPGR
jgi:hypothetical protein